MKKNSNLINDNSQDQIKNLIIVVLIISIIFVALYFVTKYILINKKDTQINESVIQSEKIIFGQLLNREAEEYYVIAYDSNNKSKSLYDKYITKYNQKENHLPFYEININEAFNKSFVADSVNITDDISKLKVNGDVLFKIKNNKIDDYKVGSSNINNYLKEISE